MEEKFDFEKFSKEIDDILNNSLKSQNHILIQNKTPISLISIGVPNLPILMTVNHIKNVIYDSKNTNNHKHFVDITTFKKIPFLINDPILIAESFTKEDSVILLIEAIDNNKNPIICLIKISSYARLNNKMLEANILTSVYGKDNCQNFINRIFKENKILFYNYEKSQDLSVNLGIQFPNVMTNLDFDIIIRKTKKFVKNTLKSFKK